MIILLHPQGFTDTPTGKKQKFYEAVAYLYIT